MRKATTLMAVIMASGMAFGMAKEAPASRRVARMATVVSYPSLYTANHKSWIAVTVRIGDNVSVLNAEAVNQPLLMHVLPGDGLNMVTSDYDGQTWVLSMMVVDKDGHGTDPRTDASDVIIDVDYDWNPNVAFVKTRRGHLYSIDKRVDKWFRKVRKGLVVSFEYIMRGSDRWAIGARIHGWGGDHVLRNHHADPVIITRIVRSRYGPNGRGGNDWWYYLWTNHPGIRFEVDARWNRDVRLQRIGEPPMWHPDMEPQPYAAAAGFLGPITGQSSPSVSVNVNNPTTVSNSLGATISSRNSVSGTNINTNSNENNNSNRNRNYNRNANNNENLNNNRNDNRNVNQNVNRARAAGRSSATRKSWMGGKR